jgi:hypothetical protein
MVPLRRNRDFLVLWSARSLRHAGPIAAPAHAR